MKQLFILRHAKSDWHSQANSDFDRPLNQRGEKDAPLIGQWLKQQQILPESIVASPAKRAKQTVISVGKTAGFSQADIHFKEELYLAGLDTLLSVIASLPDKATSALLVAHNPGMDELVEWLASGPLPLSDSGKLMTTAALAWFELPDGWHELSQGGAELKQLIRPGELAG